MDLKFGTHIKEHHVLGQVEGQGHRSKVKVKNIEVPVFKLVSEKVVQCQCHEVKVIGECHRVKFKVVGGVL